MLHGLVVLDDGRTRPSVVSKDAHVHCVLGDIEALSPLKLSDVDEDNAHPFTFPAPLNSYVLPRDVVFVRRNGTISETCLEELVVLEQERRKNAIIEARTVPEDDEEDEDDTSEEDSDECIDNFSASSDEEEEEMDVDVVHDVDVKVDL